MTTDDVIGTIVRLETRAAKLEAALMEAKQRIADLERERDDAVTRADAVTAEIARSNVQPIRGSNE